VESVNRRITVQPGLGIKMRLYLKAKKSWGSDSSGRKALNLSTNIIKKEKEMQ
jgi:arginine decarboxylase-like protein